MSNFSFLENMDGMLEIATHNMQRFSGMASVAEHTMRGKSEFSFGERELIFSYVSGLNGCKYCLGAHKAVAEAFGIDDSLLDKLINFDDFSGVAENLRPCLQLARKASQEAYRVIPSDINCIVDAGWCEETAHDVISIAALATFSNILVSAHGVEGSAAHFQDVGVAMGPEGSFYKSAED